MPFVALRNSSNALVKAAGLKKNVERQHPHAVLNANVHTVPRFDQTSAYPKVKWNCVFNAVNEHRFVVTLSSRRRSFRSRLDFCAEKPVVSMPGHTRALLIAGIKRMRSRAQ